MLRAAPFLFALLLAPLALAAEPGLLLTVQDGKGAPVADAVVSLHALDHPAAALPPPDAPVEIVQRDQEYIPYVTVVRVGTRVDFPNQDDIQHHIYSVSKAKRFEKPLYAPGARETVLFDQPGVVTIGCNIHDWMVAYLVVLPTPPAQPPCARPPAATAWSCGIRGSPNRCRRNSRCPAATNRAATRSR
jgi:plastocyanin